MKYYDVDKATGDVAEHMTWLRVEHVLPEKKKESSTRLWWLAAVLLLLGLVANGVLIFVQYGGYGR
jgi:hypothetical protein